MEPGWNEADACGLESESDESLIHAAGFLDVSEYRVMEIAFAYWHGRPADPGTIEASFHDYLERGTIPHWTRAFIRSLRQKTAQEGCSVRIIEAQPPPAKHGDRMVGAAVAIFLTLLIGVFCYLFARYPSY